MEVGDPGAIGIQHWFAAATAARPSGRSPNLLVLAPIAPLLLDSVALSVSVIVVNLRLELALVLLLLQTLALTALSVRVHGPDVDTDESAAHAST
jgi:hypothetical protein